MEEMQGLALCEQYFRAYGEPMLHRCFAQYENRIAAGLVGEGSECFGFDDAISRDHDFGPRFFLFLTNEDDATIGLELARAYRALPQEYAGMRVEQQSAWGTPRAGVLTIDAFYRRFTGCPGVPPCHEAWLAIPPYSLACAVNGAVFRDPLGRFTQIRQSLLQGYPEDVRRKKISQSAIVMAQSGQYNYSRCRAHGEQAAAQLALYRFCEAAISMLYLLNRRYMPFYKWALRGAQNLPILPQLQPQISSFLCADAQTDCKATIETVCAAVICELQRQSLTTGAWDYLEPHAFAIAEGITDQKLRTMHIMP